jgi:hypothetical protein
VTVLLPEIVTVQLMNPNTVHVVNEIVLSVPVPSAVTSPVTVDVHVMVNPPDERSAFPD